MPKVTFLDPFDLPYTLTSHPKPQYWIHLTSPHLTSPPYTLKTKQMAYAHEELQVTQHFGYKTVMYCWGTWLTPLL